MANCKCLLAIPATNPDPDETSPIYVYYHGNMYFPREPMISETVQIVISNSQQPHEVMAIVVSDEIKDGQEEANNLPDADICLILGNVDKTTLIGIAAFLEVSDNWLRVGKGEKFK